MSARERPRLRADLPFRRIAFVLSGGGAQGAYEAGALRVLSALGLRPALVAGVSAGAVNALAWIAHDGRVDALEGTWRRLDNATIGLRWTTLGLRALGVFLFVLGALEALLTILGSEELGILRELVWQHGRGADVPSVLLDAIMWTLVGVFGLWLSRLSRPVESILARGVSARNPHRLHRWFSRILFAGTMVHVVTWSLALPWPHRFSATVLVVGGVVWLINRPGPGGDRLRGLIIRALPETGGRGLWGNAARRRIVEQLVAQGDRARLLDPRTRLVMGALALDSGRVAQFVSGASPTPEFRERIERQLGEVIELRTTREILEAAVASSSLPVIFEPVEIGGRLFVDAGGFSNQPLHVALADDADAAIVVALSPMASPPDAGSTQLFELGGRLLEIANWRDMQTELASLPEDWRAPATDGTPARLCMIEPDAPLPGTLLHFAPKQAVELIRRGEQDAWRTLARAGWLEPEGAADAPPAGAGGG